MTKNSIIWLIKNLKIILQKYPSKTEDMTPRYFSHRRKYTDRDDKYRALLAQGFDETAARRMADSPDIPQIYGPKNL